MTNTNTEKLGLSTAIIVGMNAMIGAGIFSVTSLLGSSVGPAGILTYIFAFSAVWFMAQSIARVSYLYPQEGSFYTYAKQFAGHQFGLLAAGFYLAGLLIAMGLLTKISGIYLHTMMPFYSPQTWCIAALVLLFFFNIMGMTLSKIGQYILILVTVFPLITTTLMCLSKANLQNLTPFMPFGPLSILKGAKVAIFGLFGFECITSLFNIVEKPEQNVPLAVKYSLLATGIVYLTFVTSILLSIPQQTFLENPNITISEILNVLFPGNMWLIHLVAISIIFALLGTIHSMIWSSSALLRSYTKALGFKEITQTLAVFIACSSILIAALSISNLTIFFSLTNVGIIFAYICAMLPLLKLKSEWKSGQNYTTMLGLIAAFVIFGTAIASLVENVIPWLK